MACLDDPARAPAVIHERKARAQPRGHAAVQILRVIAKLFQATDRRGAAAAASTDRDDAPSSGQLAQPLAERTDRDVLGAVDVARAPLVLFAHIEEVVVGERLPEIDRVHLSILPFAHNDRVDAPYPVQIVPLIPEFLTRRRVKFTFPLRVMDELGIDRPAFTFVVGGVALQPDEGAHLSDIFNPYATIFDQWNVAAAMARGAGLVDEVGGRWRVTARGRELFARVRREADAYLAALAPIPAGDLTRLAALLAKALAAVEASDVPHDHISRTRYFVGDGRIPMVALENALMGLWHARDDSHMSSWRAVGIAGPTLDVLTRLWRKEASTDEELRQRLAQQHPDDVTAGLASLRRDGFLAPGALELTERGASLRQSIEDETDRRFFDPWPAQVAEHAGWIHGRLAAVNAALLPAS